jgi:hypothetical protein
LFALLIPFLECEVFFLGTANNHGGNSSSMDSIRGNKRVENNVVATGAVFLIETACIRDIHVVREREREMAAMSKESRR